MGRGARYRDDSPARVAAVTWRAMLAALIAFVLPGPALAGAEDLAACLDAKATLPAYADDFVARGWRPVAEGDADHDRALRSTAEIIGTLRTFPVAFTEPEQVRDHVERIVSFGRQAVSTSQAVLLARDGLSLLVLLETRGGEARLTCYLGGRAIPDVIRRLPEPGRNPSGEPLAWNLASSGPLETRHLFAEIMYVRLFFQPAQHLLAGGDGIVTHLTFRRPSSST